jgi:hypothetical protein
MEYLPEYYGGNIQLAIDAAGEGGTVRFAPKTEYRFTEPLVQSHSCQKWIGGGRYSTSLVCTATEPTTAIRVAKGANPIWWTEFSGFNLFSSTTQSVGIDVGDARGVRFRDINIVGYSTGMLLRGREFIDVGSSCVITAHNPIEIAFNPNSYIGLDHSKIRATLISTGGPCVKADGYLSNSTFSGSWNSGTHGFYYKNTGDMCSHNICFRDLRTEQGEDAGAYSFVIDGSGAALVNAVKFDNVLLCPGRNGIDLAGVRVANLYDVFSPGTSNRALNVSGVDDLNLEGCYWNAGSTAFLDPALIKIFGGPVVPAGGPLPGTACYSTRLI